MSWSLIRSGVVVLALVIMPPSLGAVAAGRHRAPAALARTTVVEEQPAAFGIGAAPHPVEPWPGQQVTRRPQHRRQQRERGTRPGVDVPFVAAAVALQGRAGRRLCEGRIESLEVTRARDLALGLRVEQLVDRLAQG